MGYDAVIVGSGPNGLAAAIRLQQYGLQTLVVEGDDTPGGGMRTSSVTLPGYFHDHCSMVHPLAFESPFFQQLKLSEHGLQWIIPEVACAHVIDRWQHIALHRSIDITSGFLQGDRVRYVDVMKALASQWDGLRYKILAPLLPPAMDRAFLQFAFRGITSAQGFSTRHWKNKHMQAVWAGMAAHGMLPLNMRGTTAMALVLNVMVHSNGWPFPRGGAASITHALIHYYRLIGGVVQTGQWIDDIGQLPPARVVLWDTSPVNILNIYGDRLPRNRYKGYQRYRYGVGVFKVDYALDDPVPFRSKELQQAGTLHLGGGMQEISLALQSVWQGKIASRPFIILTQPSRYDKSRVPEGKHVVSAYCHVPAGCEVSHLETITDEIDQVAPGFRDCIRGVHTIHAGAMHRYNPNYIGGDINGGVQNLRQILFRPVVSLSPYETGIPHVYLCSSSTPPGGGVHGMCGYHAAGVVLRKSFGIRL